MQQTVITQHSPRTKRPRTTSTGNGAGAKVSVAGADVTTMVGAGVAPHGIRGGVVAMTEKAMDGGAQKRRKLLNNEVDRIKSLEAENGQLDFSMAASVEPQRVLIRGCYQVAEQRLVHFANNKIQQVSRSTQPVWTLALQNIEAITPQT
ncbi:hypothetical protein GNI_195420 [Gregarina niphandrodes]|uniref:Uncharacterized protein n=1 Tax=Gregarina niphandrodes TaxID=110365 RepID=A0A023AX65_GRENI|nr:hypothetical protein GNI_195420 [Gregarina niphandrodes]EZG43023.1 hypothetical protein GNI_195420 [Gregarina niphandrodes]|eukprot:XP_011133704.1 hypothetical protein GNI_195420 [Gregarina niphandrodes]